MKSKSYIIQSIGAEINRGIAAPTPYTQSGQETEKRSGKIIKWTIQIDDVESMIDAHGIKWIRAIVDKY